MCVSERGIAETNEGHPDDLDSCKWRRLTETYQYWCFFVFFVFFDYACMYEEYLHGLTSSLTGGQTLVKHVPLHPSSTSSTSSTSYTPCLPVNGHPSDCQGISQVVVQLTLTYFTCVVLGVHLLSFSAPVAADTRSLVWNTVMARTAVGCLILSLHFSTLIRSQNGRLPLHFLAVL